MVFNWFRRQNSDRATPQQEEPTPDPVEPTELAEVALEEPAQDVASDHLIWAKAAYKNIQQQPQQIQETTAEDESGNDAEAENSKRTEAGEPKGRKRKRTIKRRIGFKP